MFQRSYDRVIGRQSNKAAVFKTPQNGWGTTGWVVEDVREREVLRTEKSQRWSFICFPPNLTFPFISLHLRQADVWPENNSPVRQGFSHFLTPNLIEMSKLVLWLCQRDGNKKKSRINHAIWNCICRKDVRKGQRGDKGLSTPSLLLTAAGPSPGLWAAPWWRCQSGLSRVELR